MTEEEAENAALGKQIIDWLKKVPLVDLLDAMGYEWHPNAGPRAAYSDTDDWERIPGQIVVEADWS